MKVYNLLLVCMLLFGACARDTLETRPDATTAGSAAGIAHNGKASYNEYCAGCHETGMLGAPVAGDAADWGDRSQLWDAVLLDHAITGYLEMPAKGGRTDLPNDVVRSAAEYMLRLSFPDMQHDCNPPLCGETQE